MNLTDFLNPTDKDVLAWKVFNQQGSATLLSIKQNAVLKEHQSISDAMLLLLQGQASYQEDERTVELTSPMDYVLIPARVTHRVIGKEDSLLLLIH